MQCDLIGLSRAPPVPGRPGAAAGMGVEVSRRRDSCELTILDTSSGKSFLSLEAGGQARWYYEPATGPATSPATSPALLTVVVLTVPGRQLPGSETW
jgi:hypothetical protein